MTVSILPRKLPQLSRFVNSVVFGKKNLLLTNALISTGMGALGDGIQQNYDILKKSVESKGSEEKTKFEWRRTNHMSWAGLTTGVVTHYWYIILDKWLGNQRTFGLITKKVLLDQILFSPVNISVYFITLGICERASLAKIKDELMEKGFERIYVTEWFIWPPAQYFNFYVLPLKYRILFDNVISMGFDIYCPYIKYKIQLKKEREALKEANKT